MKSKLLKASSPDVMDLLQQALSSEWLAYNQYRKGSEILLDKSSDLSGELNQHAQDELEHAVWISERILQLGGSPMEDPEAWLANTPCGYDEPTDPDPAVLVAQNLDGERCAVKFYTGFSGAPGVDPDTREMVLRILEKELEHYSDLESLRP
jgi:bacterioferritin